MSKPAGPDSTDVVILCGGLGKRLQSVLKGGQKVVAEISGRSFLRILIDDAARQGFRRFVLCLGHAADEVRRACADFTNAHPGVEVEFSVEEKPLGTAGAVKNAAGHIRSDPFLVLNGDSFCPFEYSDLLKFHLDRKSVLSVALVQASPSSDGGFVRIDERLRIVGFREKSFEAAHSYLNAGVYAMARRVLENILAGAAVSMEVDLIPSILAEPVHGFPTGAALHDIGTPERLEAFRKVYGEKTR